MMRMRWMGFVCISTLKILWLFSDSFSVGGLIPFIFKIVLSVRESHKLFLNRYTKRHIKFTIFAYPYQTSEPATVVILPFMSDYRLGHLVYITVGIESRSDTLLVQIYHPQVGQQWNSKWPAVAPTNTPW